MNAANSRTLSNDFQAVTLYCLRHWEEAPIYSPDGGGGPFVVIQTGIAPEDVRATISDFILGRNGHWLDLGLFQALPKEVRRQAYLFATAAEAVQVLQQLTGTPVVDRGQAVSPEAGPDQPAVAAEADPLHEAIAQARARAAKADAAVQT